MNVEMRVSQSSARLAVIDLFCGVGGMTYGFAKEGFEIIAGIDIDSTCEYAFEANNKADFLKKNVETMSASELLSLYPEGAVRILIGCAPCQLHCPA